MKDTVTKSQFIDAFTNMGRGDSFSYAGFSALFDYLEELEEDCGTEIELDPVALDCEYSEHDSVIAFAGEYFADINQAASELGLEIAMSGDEFEDEDEEIEEAIREYIHDRGQLIEFEGGIIVSSF